MTTTAANGVASISSSYSFADTVERLRAALAARGAKVFATIDHTAAAAAAGLTMPPATLVIFGDPSAGTALMLERPLAALDLPFKLLVTESTPGDVVVSFNEPDYVIRRHGLPAELRRNLPPAERIVSEAVAR